MWPDAYEANGRTSSTVVSPGSSSSPGSAGRASHGPRFSATTRPVVGGRGVETEAETRMNSCASWNSSAVLLSRSWPIVDERSVLMFPPHKEPAT